MKRGEKGETPRKVVYVRKHMETGKSEQVREEAWDQTPPLRCTVT